MILALWAKFKALRAFIVRISAIGRKFGDESPKVLESPANGGKFWIGDPELYKSPAFGGIIRPMAES